MTAAQKKGLIHLIAGGLWNGSAGERHEVTRCCLEAIEVVL